jgi:transcriptional regulator with XRE-family HTH domain
MYISKLQMIMKSRGINQSDIAKIAGISRQSVSLWFSQDSDFQNIQILHIMKLSEGLNISIDELVKPMPILNDPEKRKSLFTEFCWDYLYPDIGAFFVALLKNEWPAVGRLVTCRGLYESANLLGEIVWDNYHLYSKYIHPVKKKECDHIWKIHPSLIAA